MGNFDTKFGSQKQDWSTPQDLYTGLAKRYCFDFDLAANSHNAKCDRYFSEQDDALSQPWRGRCWLNPPYGARGRHRLSCWVKKAHSEAARKTCTVTMLMPARTNTKWWHQFCMTASELLFVVGRPRFEGSAYGLPQPLAVVTWGTERFVLGSIGKDGATMRLSRYDA